MTDGADPSARRPGAATGKTATGKLIRWSDSLNISPRARRRWVVTYAPWAAPEGTAGGIYSDSLNISPLPVGSVPPGPHPRARPAEYIVTA